MLKKKIHPYPRASSCPCEPSTTNPFSRFLKYASLFKHKWLEKYASLHIGKWAYSGHMIIFCPFSSSQDENI